jgi:hypothetical protein
MSEKQEQTYTLPASLVHAIAEYLSQRPYREVAGYIAALGNIGPNARAE